MHGKGHKTINIRKFFVFAVFSLFTLGVGKFITAQFLDLFGSHFLYVY